MSEANGKPGPCRSSTKRARRDPETDHIAQECLRLGLAEPVTGYGGLDAVFVELDLAVVVLRGDDPAKDRRRINRAAKGDWRVIVCTRQEWHSLVWLDLVAKAVAAAS